MAHDTSEHVRKSLCFYGFWAWFMYIFLIVGSIFFFIYIIRKFIRGPYYTKENRIDGKVVVITGCNAGIGKETALELARRGGRIYMACRDATRCEAARLEIIERTGNQNVFNRSLDLSSLESVRNFADRFLAEEEQLDILINNAGVFGLPHTVTINGFEQQFGVNHLGHFLLTNLLLPRLKASAPSRIVIVSSILYIFGRINKEDLNGELKYKKSTAYAQSKLANLLFMRKLVQLLKDTQVTVNSVHPGIVGTDLFLHSFKGPLWLFIKCLSGTFSRNPRSGAQPSLRVALDPKLEKSTGGFYYSDTLRWPLLPRARNIEMADWLWTQSEKMVGMRPATGSDKRDSIVINHF